PDAAAVANFLQFVADRDGERAKECLSAVSSTLTALAAPAATELKRELKPVLQDLLGRGPNTPLFVSAQLLAARLGVAPAGPAARRARFSAVDQSEAARLQALDALLAFRDPALLTALPEVLSSGSPSFLGRVLAALGRVEDPKLAEILLDAYPKLAPEVQPLVIDLILQREAWSRKLLDAVLAGRLPRATLNANHLRRILESNDREAIWAVEKAFGQVREERNPQREQIVAEMGAYFRGHTGDPRHGQVVFRNLCAQCHTIYGDGGKLGPDTHPKRRAAFH